MRVRCLVGRFFAFGFAEPKFLPVGYEVITQQDKVCFLDLQLPCVVPELSFIWVDPVPLMRSIRTTYSSLPYHMCCRVLEAPGGVIAVISRSKLGIEYL